MKTRRSSRRMTAAVTSKDSTDTCSASTSLFAQRNTLYHPSTFSLSRQHHLESPVMPHWHRQQLSLDLSCLGFLDGQHCYIPNTLVVDQTLVCRSLFPHIQLQQPEHV